MAATGLKPGTITRIRPMEDKATNAASTISSRDWERPPLKVGGNRQKRKAALPAAR